MTANASRQPEPNRRATGSLDQLGAVLRTELPRLIRGRRLRWLAAVQLAPVAAAFVFIRWLSLDGLHVYGAVVEWAVFPFLIPLTALFYGGPMLVDEIERETLPYLTLRPVPKWVLYAGKWLSGALVASALVLLPLVLLYAATTLAGPGGGPAADTFALTLLASALSTAAYASVFAALGVWVAKSVIGGVIYFVLFDAILGQIPVFEWATVRYHVFNIGDFDQPSSAETLDALLSAGDVSVPWGGSVAFALVWTAGMVALGAAVFATRTYEI